MIFRSTSYLSAFTVNLGTGLSKPGSPQSGTKRCVMLHVHVLMFFVDLCASSRHVARCFEHQQCFTRPPQGRFQAGPYTWVGQLRVDPRRYNTSPYYYYVRRPARHMPSCCALRVVYLFCLNINSASCPAVNAVICISTSAANFICMGSFNHKLSEYRSQLTSGKDFLYM